MLMKIGVVMKSGGRKQIQERLAGVTLVVVAAMMTTFMLALAVGVDLGFAYMVRTQLQGAADPAALAGAAQLMDEDLLAGIHDLSDNLPLARNAAVSYAAFNKSTGESMPLDINDANFSDGDVVIGYLENPSDIVSPFLLEDLSQANSVQVTIRRFASNGNPVDLFFSHAFGDGQSNVWATATATVDDRVIGFTHVPGSDETYPILPFALDRSIFEQNLVSGPDDWTYDADVQSFAVGGDGISEILMYPYKLKENPEYENPAGNFGTVDIGGHDNSTSELSRQILVGISGIELDTIDGLILEDHSGSWYKDLNGDTGMSVAIKDELEAAIGEDRILPLFDILGGSGDNSMFRIVRFVPVRIVDVGLTGAPNTRHVLVQPFQQTSRNAVTAPTAPSNGLLYKLSLTR